MSQLMPVCYVLQMIDSDQFIHDRNLLRHLISQDKWVCYISQGVYWLTQLGVYWQNAFY